MNFHRSKSILLLLLPLLFSCSAGRFLYPPNSILKNEIASAQETSLQVPVPSGWYSPKANAGPFIDLWLVKEDFTASITFNPIHIDHDKQVTILPEDILSEIIAQKKVLYSSIKIARKRNNFSLGKLNCSDFEYSRDENNIVRVVLFSYKNSFYESSAFFKSDLPVEKRNYSELFKTQNSILNAVK